MANVTIFQPGYLEEVRDEKDILYSPPKEELDKIRPIDYVMELVAKNKYKTDGPHNRTFIIQASTGSGKSTVIPPEFYHRFFSEFNGRNIACTQPRILTSVDIPNTIIKYHTPEALKNTNRKPLVMGKNIGYQTSTFVKKPIRGLIYMTVGTLTQQLNTMSDSDLIERYSAIFIDEVHERSFDTDYVLYALKRFIARNYKNKNCPFLFIMSATFDVWKFTDYLLPTESRYQNIVRIKGFTYEISDHYLAYDSTNYIQSVLDTILAIHQKSDDKKLQLKKDRYRDILVFLPGTLDIKILQGRLNKMQGSHPFLIQSPLLLVELHRESVRNQMGKLQQLMGDLSKLKVEINQGKQVVFKTPTRRVFLATNVAETGITIHTLKYVIETGWYKSNEFDPVWGIESLVTKPVTKSMAIQRRGRVGREDSGKVFYMYSHDTFQALDTEPFPDIIKDEITLGLLHFIISEVDPENLGSPETFAKEYDITSLDLLDPPSADSLHYSMEKLFTLGAIDQNSLPTGVGLLMNKFRYLPLESIRMIMASYAWKVSTSLLINIAAVLEVGLDQLFVTPPSKQEIIRLADDFILAGLTLQTIIEYMGGLSTSQLNKIEKFAEKKGYSPSTIHRVIETREDIIFNMALLGLDPYAYSGEEDIQALKQCIFEGYKLNIAIWDAKAQVYRSRRSHVAIQVSGPTAQTLIQNPYDIAKYGDANPRYLIYSSLHSLPKKNTYTIKAECISIIDGYIDLDANFDTL